jgi:hypothetical protein
MRGAKDWSLRTEVDCTSIVPVVCPATFKCLAPVICGAGAPEGFVASGSSLVLPRAAAGTRGKHSTLHCAGASTMRRAMQEQ